MVFRTFKSSASEPQAKAQQRSIYFYNGRNISGLSPINIAKIPCKKIVTPWQANDFARPVGTLLINSKHIYIMKINYLSNKLGYKYQCKK
jgi:hypothetical protein